VSHTNVRVALVGCGRIARNHVEAIARVDGLELTAVCDSDTERARSVGEAAGVPSFTSFDEMLREASCDAVAICTPSGLHPAQGIAAARAGKHVISEKPMAISLSEADELVAACDAAEVHLFVVKQNRQSSCCGARWTRAGLAASTSRTPPCAGRGRRSTTTRRRGAAPGSSTAVRS